MSLDIQTIRAAYSPVAGDLPLAGHDSHRQASRSETLATAAATAIGVLIVAVIAVLMSLG